MKTQLIDSKILSIQNDLYSWFNKNPNKIAGLFVCGIDVTLEMLSAPLDFIENIAMAAFNLIAAAFSTNYSLKDVLFCFQNSVSSLFRTPAEIAFFTFKACFQLYCNLNNPKNAKSIYYSFPLWALRKQDIDFRAKNSLPNSNKNQPC